MSKPLLSRPLDILYIVFFIIHLVWSIPFGGQPLYPKWIIPQWAGEFIQNYIRDTNDPWILAAWDLVPRPFEWVWTKVFLWAEMVVSVPVFFIGMYALVKDLPTYYPMFIAYSAYATITTTTTTTLTLAVPTKTDMGLSPEMAFYAMPVDEKKQVVIANAVFLAVPIVMLLDMSMRTIGLVKKGLQVERQKKRV